MNKPSPTQLRRAGANLAALAVGLVAATATWNHIAAVGAKYGEPMAAFLPLSVDGMMIAGVLMAADAKAAGRKVGPWPRIATWVGGVLSIAAQIESGRARGIAAAAIATVFSVTLIITVEALFARRSTPESRPSEAPAPAPTVVAAPVEVSADQRAEIETALSSVDLAEEERKAEAFRAALHPRKTRGRN